jgi:hypothetical protein
LVLKPEGAIIFHHKNESNHLFVSLFVRAQRVAIVLNASIVIEMSA